MQRRALVVGINQYDCYAPLRCAINDANRMQDLLARNDDGTVNYDVRSHLGERETDGITRAGLRQMLLDLFADFSGDVLLYFAGHGAMTPWGGYLVTQDGTKDEHGVSMEDLLLLANRSRAREVVLILDCCHSGDLGDPPILQALSQPLALVREGLTILAASRPNEPAYEIKGHGVFSDALAEGLAGGAADHLGNVSAASLFLYAERLFDAWDQQPIYKSYTSRVPTLRTCKPPLPSNVLRSIRQYFATAEALLTLDPEYESEPKEGDDDPTRAKKRDDARVFKQLRDARMLESTDGSDFYWTAMNSKAIQLTHLGKYYWRLLKTGKL